MHQITERNKNLQTIIESTLQNEKLSSLRLAKLVQSFRKQEYGLKKCIELINRLQNEKLRSSRLAEIIESFTKHRKRSKNAKNY